MIALLLTFLIAGQALIGVVAEKTDDAFITPIPVGSSLHLNSLTLPSSWLSPSGRFAFGFHQNSGQGFSICVILDVSPKQDPEVIWTADVDRSVELIPWEAVLFFTGQGFLLKPSNEAENITVIGFNGTVPAGAAMLDSGNFIVYDLNFKRNCSLASVRAENGVRRRVCITWQSFDHPTDTMMGGQVLNCPSNLTSGYRNTEPSRYSLIMQCDANLVLYAVNTTDYWNGSTTTDLDPIWSTQTFRKPYIPDNQFIPYSKFVLGERGHLFISTSDGANQLDLSQYNPTDINGINLYRAKLELNEYFCLSVLNLITNESSVIYQIPTGSDACEKQNFCGLNSYCVMKNNKPDCSCLPGFTSTFPDDPARGCQRSTAESLNCSDPASFAMESVDNLVLYGEAYSVVSAESKEDCRDTCLSECNCEAAVFSNKNCAKHKVPISRANRGTNFTNNFRTAYIKIAAEAGRGNADKNQRWRKYLAAVLSYGAIDAGVFFALLLAGTGSYWMFYGRYRLRWRKWVLAFQEEIAPRSFSFREVIKATDSFITELGRGGHATVFLGHLNMYGRPNPVPVAVKRINAEDEKGDTDFEAEIRIIGRAHHKNLVRLLGFCYENSKRLLIYEYMSWGSLADLISRSGRPGWTQQAKILLGVARGIDYLHHECETQIIHRDIKPENILIAENWAVKISDFGISKLLMEGAQATWTKRTSAPGTPGYVAPECVLSKGENATEKADVYSFGIVVLETVFWERNAGDNNNLLEFARKYCREMEEKIEKKVEVADAEWRRGMMMKLGMLCVQEQPSARPDMEDVILSMLEDVLALSCPAAIVAPQIISSGKKISWAPTVK